MSDTISSVAGPLRILPEAAPESRTLLRNGDGNGLPLLTRYLRIAMRWKWVILGCIAAALLIGLVATLMMTPLYTAVSTIEISRDSDKVTKLEGVEREASTADLEFYQTQYGLLKARSLAERVARELKLSDDPKFFEAFKTQPTGTAANLANQRYAAAGAEQRVRDAATVLLKNVTVTPVRASRLVEIGFTSPDAGLSTRVANAWGQQFIESNLGRRFEATAYARKFLEDRLEQLRVRLEESERMLVNYAANQKIVNVPSTVSAGGENAGATTERSLVADDLSALNTELSSATADRIRAESRLRGGTSAESLSNVAISSLRQRRAEAAADYAKLMIQFEPGYPAARAIASQIAQLDQAIAREEGRVSNSLQTGYRDAITRERALSGRVEGLKTGLIDLKRRSIQYNIYQRDVDTNRQLYDGLLQRYKEIGVAGGVGTNNVSIVDIAQLPDRPSQPRLFNNLLLSLLIGLLIGGGLAFALEQIDEAIADPADVEGALGLPLLGAVPMTGDVEPMAALQDRKSSLVEAYLSVQTNLEFATAHGAPRSLSVTSTRPSEGKSTTAFALAQSLARGKRKVALIDGDMRSPSVHGLFGLKNDRGVSNVLAGSDDLAAMLHTTAQEGLVVMTAGPQPPNAAELLSGERLGFLIAKLLETVDHVIVDSPPVMGLADAPLIASKVEGTVFAVESHGIRTSLVRVALGRLSSANARLLGIVLTKFESKRAHYGYGYDYGYGYGEKGRDKSWV
jgi:polysaccharide biosynthesis transport protein